MNKNLLISIFASILFTLGYYAYSNETLDIFNKFSKNVPREKKFTNFDSKQIKIGLKEYKIYLAKTEQEKNIGLAAFDALPENEGMLFSFDQENNYVFWMKNMKFNIDIIFLDKEKQIIEIFENVKAQKGGNNSDLKTYSAKLKSQHVIELNEGEIKKSEIKLGDILVF